MQRSIRRFLYHGEDRLSLPAEREAFTTLKAWLCDICQDLQLPDKNRKQLLIVADEIFSNIANYGYPDGRGSAAVAVEFHIPERELILTFSDSGAAYNPLETTPPDVTSPLEERDIGGLGIFMVRQMMDVVEYRREDNRNILTLRKRLAPAAITAAQQ